MSTPSPAARALQLPAAVEVAGLVVLGVVTAVLEVLYLPLRVGSTPVPVTILVAAVVNVTLVQASGERTTRTVVAAAPLLAWVLLVLATAFSGPGGDVLLVNDWRAVALLVAGVVPPAVHLGALLGRNAARRGTVVGAPGARSTVAAGAQSPR